jgi:hypothetical protein
MVQLTTIACAWKTLGTKTTALQHPLGRFPLAFSTRFATREKDPSETT